jgi:hypothetical protein
MMEKEAGEAGEAGDEGSEAAGEAMTESESFPVAMCKACWSRGCG